LVQRAQANDQQACSAISNLSRPLVQFSCRQARCPDADVEDVNQEIFAAVAAGLKGFRHDRAGDTFRGWLRGITRNQVLLYFRRNLGRPRPEGGSDALGRLQELPDLPSVSTEDETAEVRQWYGRAVEQVRGEFEEW